MANDEQTAARRSCTRATRRRRASVALILAAIGAVPLARAVGDTTPTLQADRPCYTTGEPLNLTGGGYAPSSSVAFFFQLAGKHGNNLLAGDTPSVADASGAITARYGVPKLASSDDTEETLSITGAQLPPDGQPPSTTPPPFGRAQVEVSVFDVFVSPWDHHQVDPRKTVAVSAFGYEPATKLWAHYVLNGKRVKSVLVGALTGPCGDLVKHMREFPFHPVPAGKYSVYFQGSQTLNKQLRTPYRNVVVPHSKAIN